MNAMDLGIFETILIILAIAVLVSIVFRRLHLPVVLGYILIGILIGPFGFAWIVDVQNTQHIAEFGIVFLMFTVGLEFSLAKLIALRRIVFVLGTLQVLLTILIVVLAASFFPLTFVGALVIGCIAALSSTAIVAKQLGEQFELTEEHGVNAIGILLFQDLAVVPILILFAGLSITSTTPITNTFVLALVKGLIAIGLIVLLGQWLLRPLFHQIAKIRSVELFSLTALLIALSAAWFTQYLGLSYVLGAFLAGMLLGETEYRHQIEVEIRPFRDILMGLFFISIGMLLNIASWGQTWPWILLLAVALIVGKPLLIIALTRLFGYRLSCSIRTGLVLAQGGEFGFAILTVALTNNLLPLAYGQAVLGALLVSMALAPLLIYFNGSIAYFLTRKKSQAELPATNDPELLNSTFKNHIIICGFGRVGQNVARIVENEQLEYLAIDIDPEIVNQSRLAGDNITYGDATHPDILKAANIERASVVLISFDNIRLASRIINTIREMDKSIPVVVRCKDESEYEDLKRSGATEIITETFEESLMLAYHLLLLVKVPREEASHLIQGIRHDRYQLLREVFTSSLMDLNAASEMHQQLRPVILTEDSTAINKAVEDLNLQEIDCRIISIRRGQKAHIKPDPAFKLQPGDILVLFGEASALSVAEDRLHLG